MVLYVENGVLRGVLNRDADGDFMNNEPWTSIGILSIEYAHLQCLEPLTERNVRQASIVTVSEDGVPKLTFGIHSGRLSLTCDFPRNRKILEAIAGALNPVLEDQEDGQDGNFEDEDVMEED